MRTLIGWKTAIGKPLLSPSSDADKHFTPPPLNRSNAKARFSQCVTQNSTPIGGATRDAHVTRRHRRRHSDIGGSKRNLLLVDDGNNNSSTNAKRRSSFVDNVRTRASRSVCFFKLRRPEDALDFSKVSNEKSPVRKAPRTEYSALESVPTRLCRSNAKTSFVELIPPLRRESSVCISYVHLAKAQTSQYQTSHNENSSFANIRKSSIFHTSRQNRGVSMHATSTDTVVDTTSRSTSTNDVSDPSCTSLRDDTDFEEAPAVPLDNVTPSSDTSMSVPDTRRSHSKSLSVAICIVPSSPPRVSEDFLLHARHSSNIPASLSNVPKYADKASASNSASNGDKESVIWRDSSASSFSFSNGSCVPHVHTSRLERQKMACSSRPSCKLAQGVCRFCEALPDNLQYDTKCGASLWCNFFCTFV